MTYCFYFSNELSEALNSLGTRDLTRLAIFLVTLPLTGMLFFLAFAKKGYILLHWDQCYHYSCFTPYSSVMLSFVLKPSFSYFKTLHLPVTEAILVDILSEKSSETKNPLNTKKHEALHCGKMLLVTLTTVLQIRDFQLVSLKSILKPQLVQKSCIFPLPRNIKNGILYHVYIRYSHKKYTLIMFGHLKKSASVLTDQNTQMVSNDGWPATICNTEQWRYYWNISWKKNCKRQSRV